ncbi:MAG: hypothetical protein IJW99_03315 [Clostridia bacterium]|nr:hypothetical protein [Clostridia bacterium]
MSRYPDLGAAFSPIHRNLAELDRRQTDLLECRMAHMEEWARAARRFGGEERDSLLRFLDALHPETVKALPEDVPAVNREELTQALRALALPERLFLFRTLAAEEGEEIFSERDEDGGAGESNGTDEVPERARDKIAYLRNSYADSAYLRFSATLAHPRAAYFDSFADVCEEVYNGICEYGILPLFHSRDGRLHRFFSMLEKYDLRVVCACEVPAAEREGVTVTRFALVRKRFLPIRRMRPSHAELMLPAGDDDLCELLSAARLCGMTTERVDTRPAEDFDETGAQNYLVSLRLPREHAPLAAFLAFLSLDLPRATVTGLYRILRES